MRTRAFKRCPKTLHTIEILDLYLPGLNRIIKAKSITLATFTFSDMIIYLKRICNEI